VPVFQRLQTRWRPDYGRENRLGLNVWRNKNALRVDLNTANEVLETTSLLSEFQTVGAVQQKARSAKWVLVVGSCSKRVSEERRRREIGRDLMWRARYTGVDEWRILNVSTASLYLIRWGTGTPHKYPSIYARLQNTLLAILCLCHSTVSAIATCFRAVRQQHSSVHSSVRLFVQTDLVTTISHERLERSWRNLEGIFISPHWWPG